jgi:hypothetical protein
LLSQARIEITNVKETISLEKWKTIKNQELC